MFDSHLIELVIKATPIILIAYLVRGICGFGSGLIAIPVLSLMLPLKVAVPLVVILDYLASAGQGASLRQSIQWGEIRRLIIPALFGVCAGLLIFHRADADLLARLLGGFVLLYALYALWGPAMPRASSWWAIPAAISGGTIGTLFGTGGPFYVTYLKARQLDANAFRATFACMFLLDGAARVTGYLGTSVIDIKLLALLAMSLPVMILGMYLGGKIHTGLSAQVFTRSISVLLMVSGISLMVR
ncbi:MAG: sulfite exporter TauE/SafE family protein [Gammaproteobacteria bacterium]|nr:MAG: sulfite exporter TauE/SafE family protein [Gammaproteobacteria bacterium]